MRESAGRCFGRIASARCQSQSVPVATTAQIANRFEAGYDDCNAQCAVSPAYYDRVGAYSIWDLIGIWHGPKGVTIAARIRNLLDTNPPFTNKNTGLATGYDERYTNPIGREFSHALLAAVARGTSGELAVA